MKRKRRPLPVPRVARSLARGTASLAARDLATLEQQDRHILVHATAERMERAMGWSLRNQGWDGPPLVAEPDVLRFARRAGASAVEAAVLLAPLEAVGRAEAWLLRRVARHLHEKVPLVLADCPPDALPDAWQGPYDLVTPRLHGLHPLDDVLRDACLLRRLFRDGMGQGRIGRTRPGGRDAPRAWVLLAHEAGREFDRLVERLIGMGYEWTLPGSSLGVTHALRREGHPWDVAMIQGQLAGLSGVDVLRLLRFGRQRPPPCILHDDRLDADTAEAAWHSGAWAWCRTEKLHAGRLLPDLMRRAMNLRRARRDAAPRASLGSTRRD